MFGNIMIQKTKNSKFVFNTKTGALKHCNLCGSQNFIVLILLLSKYALKTKHFAILAIIVARTDI